MYEIGIEFIQKLKKSNVSRDGEKTKLRFQQLWRDASRAQKSKVLEDADVVRATIYRIYGTGAISAKIVIAASQAFNVSPFYITGDTDEPGVYSYDLARNFLLGLGYEKLVRSQLPEEPATKPKRARFLRGDASAEEVAAVAEYPAGCADVPPAAEAPLPQTASEIGEDDAILLLRALYLRAKVSLAAKKILDGIVTNLIS